MAYHSPGTKPVSFSMSVVKSLEEVLVNTWPRLQAVRSDKECWRQWHYSRRPECNWSCCLLPSIQKQPLFLKNCLSRSSFRSRRFKLILGFPMFQLISRPLCYCSWNIRNRNGLTDILLGLALNVLFIGEAVTHTVSVVHKKGRL